MTHVDWIPVTVNEMGQIIEGAHPATLGDIWVSVDLKECGNFTLLVKYKGYFDIAGASHIYAWADCKDPEPYVPGEKDE